MSCSELSDLMERSIAEVVGGIDIGIEGKDGLDGRGVAATGCKVQRRVAEMILEAGVGAL